MKKWSFRAIVLAIACVFNLNVTRADDIVGEQTVMAVTSACGEAYAPCCGNSCYSGGFFGGAEATVLKPHEGALSVNVAVGGVPVLALPITPAFDTDVGMRYWLGYRCCDGLGIRARYWDFDANGAGGLLGASTNSLEMQALDIEFTQTSSFGNWEVDVSAGVRWAKIEDSLTVLGAVTLAQEFDGIGPTIALNLRRPIGCCGFALVAGARASILFGDNDNSLTVPGLLNVTLAAADEVVAVSEIHVGGEYSLALNNGARVTARAVLESQVWDIPPAALGLLDQRVGLIGGTFSLGLEF